MNNNKRKRTGAKGSPTWKGLLQRDCFVHSSGLLPCRRTALPSAPGPSSLPAETLSHPIMPAGAHAPSAHGDRRSHHRSPSPSAGSKRMFNISWEPFVFFWEPVPSCSGAITVLVLGMVGGGGSIQGTQERGEARMLLSTSCHI